MPDLMAVIDGTPVPLTNAVWIFFFGCGCPYGAVTAAHGDDVYATEEQALREMYPAKRERDRWFKRGYRVELMAWDRYLAEIDLSARCPHTQDQRTGKAPLDTAVPACHCGQPLPAGFVAYCSPGCRLADKDHGPDAEPDGGES